MSYISRSVEAGNAIMHHLPRTLGHLVLLHRYIAPVRGALLAHEMHPSSGAFPQEEDMHRLLEVLDRNQMVTDSQAEHLWAHLRRLQIRSIVGSKGQ